MNLSTLHIQRPSSGMEFDGCQSELGLNWDGLCEADPRPVHDRLCCRSTSGTRVDPPVHVRYTFSLSTSCNLSRSKN